MLSLVSEYECRCPRDALFGLKKLYEQFLEGPFGQGLLNIDL